MKYAIAILIAVSALLGVLWLSIGGQALTIALAVLLILAVLITLFALGSWWSAKLFAHGAKIALEAQTSDDRRDQTQIKALSKLATDMLKAGQQQTAHPQYPRISPPGGDVIDGQQRFIVDGLEDGDDDPVQ